MGYSNGPLRCEICNTMTNGFECKGHILCAHCLAKYDNIPSYIAIGQWGRYARRKRKMSLLR